MKQKLINKKINAILLYLLSALVMVFFIYPLYFVVVSAFKTDTEIFSNPFLPTLNIQLNNFVRAFEIGGIARQFLNSMFLSLMTVVLCSILSSMASFAIARLRFTGQGVMRVYFVMGMMIPIQSIIVPLSYMVSTLSLRDNYALLILLYTAFYMPLSIFVVTGYMKTLPSYFEEAARIDGCNIYYIFLKIIFPLTKPALATVSIFVFMYTWNDLLVAMVLIGKTHLRTISVGLLNYVGAYNSDYGALMAAILIAILPPFIMYISMQENVVKGITSGGNK